MRCMNLKGEHCGFVVLTESVLRLDTHWTGQQTLVCPRCCGEDCSVCDYAVARSLGYVAGMMLEAGQLPVREIHLIELPESLAEWMANDSAGCTRGMAIKGKRSSVRRPWTVLKSATMNVTSEVSMTELVESVGRLYRLPPQVGTVGASFADRYGKAVAFRMAAALKSGQSVAS